MLGECEWGEEGQRQEATQIRGSSCDDPGVNEPRQSAARRRAFAGSTYRC